MRATRATSRLLATSGRRAGLATGRVLEPVRRRPSLVVVIALRVARRYRLPSLLWVADVLVHEHGHCDNVRNEYSSIRAQRRFLDAWPAGPGRERAKAYVGGLHLRLDATGNWRGR